MQHSVSFAFVPCRRRAVFVAVVALSGLAARPAAAQSIRPEWADQLSLANIGAGVIQGQSRVTQMALTDGPTADTRYLYMASDPLGLRRAKYDLTTASLVPGSLEDVARDIVGLGVAFDGDTLYASAKYVSANDGSVDLSRLWRIEDRGFGARTAIVQGIPRQDHGVDHIQIVDHTLYVGIGVRTRNGVFQTFSGDAYGESAYGGSIGVIDDLRQVGAEDNAAGFYPSDPTAQQYSQLINGQDPLAASPYTTTDHGRLRVHSSGTRNPFGVAVDGDGAIWFTNNFQRVENHVFNRDNLSSAEGDAFGGDGFQDDVHDQFFKAVPKADYGYRNGNWQDGNAAGNTAAIDAGFFAAANRAHSFTFDNFADPVASGDTDGQHPAYDQDYQLDDPVGLGPSSSSNGLAFYQANELPLAFHQDAFIARWNGTIRDGGDSLTYRDVVSVDHNTGQVRRIAAGFQNPLDVIEDGLGNLIVADYGGSIYRISAAQPFAGAHSFSWDSDQDGAWSDRLSWNAASLDEADRLVPHQWGTARYAVTIDRPLADVRVVLDRDVRIESLNLAEQLELGDGHTLTVTNYQQAAAGQLLTGLTPGGPARLDVAQTAQLDGQLRLTADLASLDRGQALAVDVITAGSLQGQFAQLWVNDRPVGPQGHVTEGYFLRTQVTPSAASVRLYAATAGDANGDEVFNSTDFIDVLAIGEYEDGVPGNSDWTEGDWDGNGDFDSSDIVEALQTGTYVAESHPAPEPASGLLLALGWLAVAARGRRAERQR